MPKSLWLSWKRLAHRAAEIQAIVLLAIVYWLVVVPVGVVRNAAGARAAGTGWKARPPGGRVSIDHARRQF